jgi:multimeric flavodoxin WrbA
MLKHINKECKKVNRVVVIFSSSRRNGNTGKLLDTVSPFINADVIDLRNYNISHYDYEHRNINDDFLPLINSVINYEAIIFASPIYWYSVTPAMKTFIDRISDLLTVPKLLETGRKLRGKMAYVLCTSVSSEVSSTYISTFKQTFEYLGIRYGGYIHACCMNGYDADECEEDRLNFIQLLNANHFAK